MSQIILILSSIFSLFYKCILRRTAKALESCCFDWNFSFGKSMSYFCIRQSKIVLPKNMLGWARVCSDFILPLRTRIHLSLGFGIHSLWILREKHKTEFYPPKSSSFHIFDLFVPPLHWAEFYSEKKMLNGKRTWAWGKAWKGQGRPRATMHLTYVCCLICRLWIQLWSLLEKR